MSDLRTLKRGRVWPHVRCVQGRLSLLLDEDETPGAIGTAPASGTAIGRPQSGGRLRHHLAGGPSVPLPVFHPPEYRGVVAGWPVPWRERWGRRANELEETGLSWRDAEAQAFVEVWNTVRHGPHAHALTPTDAERN